MSRLVSSTTMTVDSVIDVLDWFVSEGAHDDAARDQFIDSAGMVLGRRTYEGLAGYWQPEEGPWADLINPMPKFVASRTLAEPLEWNARLIDGDVLEGVSRLKRELEGDLVLIGCGELGRHLIDHGLVDEIRFWIHPAVWGEGTRPFEGLDHLRVKLLEAKAFDSGVTLLRYALT